MVSLKHAWYTENSFLGSPPCYSPLPAHLSLEEKEGSCWSFCCILGIIMFSIISFFMCLFLMLLVYSG